ncbi:MAG: cation:proton antiporter [Deltaproteobacteria bacterium]
MLLDGFHQLHMTLRSLDLHILFLLGVALFGGTMGGRLFQKIKIPQVVGYLIIGFLVGHHVLDIVNMDTLEVLQPFNYFALGLIGFMIGGELKKEIFEKYGRQFFVILFSEGTAAFLFVFLLIGVGGTIISGGKSFYMQLGLLLGAIASATAPAATTDVLWETKSRGPLTTTILGIVALDDALALLFFAVASSIVVKMSGAASAGGWFLLLDPLYKISVSVGMGAAVGFALAKILRGGRVDRDRMLILSLATVLILLGLTLMMQVDSLLAAMALGSVLANRAPYMSKEVFRTVAGFTPPIYVLFFVLVGAKLNLGHVTPALLLLVFVYLLGRSSGKMLGANIGAKLSGAPPSVQRYLPLCLFSQAGVAIALTMVVSQMFPGPMANYTVIIIAVSTFVVQLLGPPCTKLAVVRAEEVGLNITEEDLLRQARAADLMDARPPLITKNMPLVKVLDIFKSSDFLYYPVVDEGGLLVGVITLESIRQTMMETDLHPLLLAHDLMEPVKETVRPDTPLAEIRDRLNKSRAGYLPGTGEKGEYVGIIEQNTLNKYISTKMLELERKVASFS